MTLLHHPRRAGVVVTALVSAIAVSACGSTDKDQASSLQDKVTVTGKYAEKPTIKIDTPLTVKKTTAWTTESGKGDEVGADATTILGLTIADGRTGKTAISTHDAGQRPLEVKLGDQVFPSLTNSLVGRSADSRVVVASTSDDAYGTTGAPQLGIKKGDSLVMVADILSTDPTKILDGPTGKSLPAPATAPKLESSDDDLSRLDFSGLAKPKKFAVIPLREGTGPAIENPDRIAADYIGQVWGAKEPFNNTYGKEPAKFSIGLGGVIKAWDQGLAGLKEGARVMLICPPDTAYGKTAQPGIPANSTLVFVIDVLGVG
ncbi:FKBP-type peptidyl-prolyl cis-trans isomerase [Marmoricola sp. URHB0036]|uniref:FKBP-type peptidyl-prolyl cis-trans isomerase n=1 Tax=Marmoricola sp. URHB0036 TaxID=1298863 RepID=UPI000416284D|nr:FKBP-type peptidyl-prolyl cis-trans isomerase [Marmoricola sp. URHB0036]